MSFLLGSYLRCGIDKSKTYTLRQQINDVEYTGDVYGFNLFRGRSKANAIETIWNELVAKK